jgi:two-component system response regulator FlrC
LTGYDWPGNIRELENVMQRAMIMAPGREIGVEHLGLPQPTSPKGNAVAFGGGNSQVAEAGPMDIKSLERRHILDALAAANGVRKLAAERLGMSERTLRYKLHQYRAEGYTIPGTANQED